MGTAVVDFSTPTETFLADTGSYAILYYPGVAKQTGKVFALAVSSSSGRARITRWVGGAWSRK